jgi:hypothetical protein
MRSSRRPGGREPTDLLAALRASVEAAQRRKTVPREKKRVA